MGEGGSQILREEWSQATGATRRTAAIGFMVTWIWRVRSAKAGRNCRSLCEDSVQVIEAAIRGATNGMRGSSESDECVHGDEGEGEEHDVGPTGNGGKTRPCWRKEGGGEALVGTGGCVFCVPVQ